MAYRCVATSVEGFVQQLAVAYVARGYWFYVTGLVPPGKDPAAVDRKLIERYAVDVSKHTRARRKKAGLSNVQYLRHDRFFVILSTHGEHPFFAAEGKQVKDIRESPLSFHGYSVSYRQGRGGSGWHASVRIARERYRGLKRQFASIAVHQTVEDLVRELRSLEFTHYAPVRDQLLGIVRTLNRRRREAGLETLPRNVFVWRRAPVRPFAP